MATLELRHLGKTYPNGDVAVSNLDLQVGDGEFFVLVGPSGCGKTTVLRMVAGLETATVGDVLIDGEVVTGKTPQQRDVAMAFQHGALYPHMTVGENIGFSLRIAGVHKTERAARVHDVAALLDLVDVLDRSPAKLSGGQQQRVAMGRALIREPRLFLMDEPMSNLDAKLRTESRAEILTIQRRLGVTTLYVTHDQVEAMALADRVGVMRDGRLAQCDTPINVYDAPIDMFVAQFLGTPPMNLLLAEIEADRAALVARVGSHRIRLDDVSEATRHALAPLVGHHVVVGIRAEAFQTDPRSEVAFSLEFTEMLGSNQLVHAVVDARSVTPGAGAPVIDDAHTSTVTALIDGNVEVDLWRPIRLAVDTTRLHFFDPETGDTIAGPGAVSTVAAAS